MAEKPIEIVPADNDVPFYIDLTLFGGGHSARVVIAEHHTNILRTERDGAVLFEKKEEPGNPFGTDHATLNVADIWDFVNTVRLDDVRPLLRRQAEYNSAISAAGLAEDWGAEVGKTLMGTGTDLKTRARAAAAAGSDARMSDPKPKHNEKLDIDYILKDLEHYPPRKHRWNWRTPAPGLKMNAFTYQECSEPLKNSVPLPSAKYFDNIDPQPQPVITTEIASGRFEDDIRRMAEAAFASLVVQLTSPFYQLFAQEMGATDTAIGYISSLPAFCALFVLLPVSARIDYQKDKKKFLNLMILVCGAALPLVALAPFLGAYGYWFFIVGVGIWNAPYICYTIAWQGYFSDLFPPDRRSIPYARRMDLENHDLLCQVLPTAVGDVFLSQENRPKAMDFWDLVISEVHGIRPAELIEEQKKGRKVFGTFCVYVPDEVVVAANGIVTGLCGGSQFWVPGGEAVLPKNTCPLIKASVGARLGRTCPFFRIADMYVGETTCDGKKKAYEILGEDVPMLLVPKVQRKPLAESSSQQSAPQA